MSEDAVSQTAQDHAAPRDDDSVLSLLMTVNGRHGKSAFSVVKDWWPLQRGPGRITIQDYFRYQLFDETLHDADSRKQFISDDIYWPIAHKICELTWKATLEDKALMYALLEKYGLPTLTTIAVADRGEREYGGLLTIRDFDAFASFVSTAQNLPVFLKPVVGTGSAGAMILNGVDDGRADLALRDDATLEVLYAEMMGDDAYLLQTVMANHPDIDRITSHLATLRFYNFFEEEGLVSLYPMMKIPGGEHVADNFWRTGNMLAAIDGETGRIQRVIRSAGVRREEVSHHPTSGVELIGYQLPCWDEVKSLNASCARMFEPVRFVSTDLAITPDGPRVVEVNYGGSFDLPQVLYDTGFLTAERMAFFARHGWKF